MGETFSRINEIAHKGMLEIEISKTCRKRMRENDNITINLQRTWCPPASWGWPRWSGQSTERARRSWQNDPSHQTPCSGRSWQQVVRKKKRSQKNGSTTLMRWDPSIYWCAEINGFKQMCTRKTQHIIALTRVLTCSGHQRHRGPQSSRSRQWRPSPKEDHPRRWNHCLYAYKHQ